MIFRITPTCGKHAGIARRNHQNIDGVRHVWVVDAPDSGMKPPDGVDLWVMPFDRRGNLWGWECLEGMASAYRRAFNEGAYAVVRTDSDTSIDDLECLTDFGKKVFAIGAHQKKPDTEKLSWRMFGCCYSLNEAGMRLIERGVANRDYPSAVPAEDVAMSWFLRNKSRVHPWRSIRFTMNREQWKEPHFATNVGNAWILDAPASKGRRTHLF